MSRKKGLFLCEKSDYVKSQVRLINRTLNLTNRSEQIFLIRLPRLDRVILQNTRPLNPSTEEVKQENLSTALAHLDRTIMVYPLIRSPPLEVKRVAKINISLYTICVY